MGTVTTNGYTRTSYADLQTLIRAIYTDNYGSNFVVDPATPQGQQIQAFVDLMDQLEDDKVDLNNKYDLDIAIGGYLDRLGAIIGIPRLEGTPSQVNTTITSSTTGYTIPADTEFSLLDNADAVYINESDVVISSLSQSVTLVSKENLNYDIQAGDNFETVLSFNEIQDIEVDTYIDGVDVEDDSDYLSRIKLLRSGAFRQSGVQRVSASIFELDNIIDAKVYDINNYSSLNKGELQAVVLGGDNTEIANAILDTLDAGIDTVGSTTVTVQDFQGLNVDINFDTATELQIGLNLIYDLKGTVDLTTAQIQDIKDRYIEFCNDYKINEKMATSDFVNIIVPIYGEQIYIDTIKFIEATVEKDIITPDSFSYIRADETDLTVEKVV